MKKRKTKVLVVSLMLAMVLNCLAPMLDVSARQETITISDTFDDGELVGAFDTDVWTAYAGESAIKVEELAKPQKVLKCEAKSLTGESNVLMSKDWYWEIHSFSFDMYMPANTNWDNSKWAFLDFVDIDSPDDYVGDNGEHGKPLCYDAFKVNGLDDFGLSQSDWKYWGFDSDTIGDCWISVKVVSNDANTGKFMIAPKGKAFDESKAQNITLAGNKSFYNSNIVFGDYKFAGYLLDNIVIETDTGTFKENFEDGKNDLFEEIAITKPEETSFSVIEYGGSRKLAFKDAVQADRVIANAKLKQEAEHLKDSDKVMDASFTVDYKTNKTNEEIAYVFGLVENDSDPFTDTWAFIMGRNSGRLSYFGSDGTETVHATKKFGTSLKGNKITLSLTKSGIFTASLDGKKVLKYNGVETYEGYVGFAAKTDISNAIYLDEVVIKNELFKVITTRSWADDFTENKLGSGTNSDYAWNADSGSISVANEEVVFAGCSDYTYFGPAYEYETYELSFQLTSIYGTDNEDEKFDATYLGRWIGIDFGKASSSIRTYGTYGMLAVNVRPPEDGSKWKEAGSFLYNNAETSALTEAVMTHVKPIPTSYFENITYDGKTKQREEISADDAVCFKFVALENKLELYMKRASDKNYTLYTTVDNVDSKGYVALACTGYSYWSIDNYEIKNTAEIYNEAPPAVIPEVVLPTLAERGVGVESDAWTREQKLNAEKEGTSPIIWIAGGSGVALVGIAAFVIYQVQKKKKAKSNEEN